LPALWWSPPTRGSEMTFAPLPGLLSMERNPAQVLFVERDHMIEQLPPRAPDPTLRHPVLPGRFKPLERSTLRTSASNFVSRSRIAYLYGVESGNASRNCWMTQSEFGCAVTWKCGILRRACSMTKAARRHRGRSSWELPSSRTLAASGASTPQTSSTEPSYRDRCVQSRRRCLRLVGADSSRASKPTYRSKGNPGHTDSTRGVSHVRVQDPPTLTVDDQRNVIAVTYLRQVSR
jgi:hypothetical protein